MSLAGLLWLTSRCVLDRVGAAALPRSPALLTVSSVGGVACPPQWLPVLLAFGNLPTPDPINGEEACEGHGYGKASCAEVGCCQYAECSIGDGSGECFSAVGPAQCTPVEFSSHVETCP